MSQKMQSRQETQPYWVNKGHSAIPKTPAERHLKTPENGREAQGKRGRNRAMEREVRTGERAGTAGTAWHLPLPPVPARESHPGQT